MEQNVKTAPQAGAFTTHGNRKMRIVAADDVDLVLTGIKAILTAWDECDLLGVYACLPDLLHALRTVSPDVIIVGDRLDMDYAPLKLIDTLKALTPRARLVLLGNMVDGFAVQELFKRSIHAYLYKSDPLTETLIPALRAVSAGKPYLSPTASAEYLLSTQSGSARFRLDSEALLVLQRLADGCTVQEIAAQLKVTVRHVYWVREKLRRRFGASTNEVIISRARLEGFIP